MRLNALRFSSLLFVALTLGLAFAHVLEIPGKFRLSGPEWLTVQQHLYIAFGSVGGIVEVAAIVLTWLVLMSTPRGRAARWWTALAATCATVGLADWALVVSPMNTVLNAWTAQSIPADWTAVRARWEIGHAIQAALFAGAFGALVAGLLGERGESRR
jgi:hypothetical protein